MNPTQAQISAAARRYIGSRRDTLWGRAYDISDPDQARLAAGWLTTQIVAVLEMANADTLVATARQTGKSVSLMDRLMDPESPFGYFQGVDL